MGLLNYLTATSLDEDYALASERRSRAGATSRARPGRWALVALAVFGVLVATAAVQTSRNAEVSARSRTTLVTQAEAGRDELNGKRTRIAQLQRQISTLQAGELAETTTGRAVQIRLTQLGVVTGSAAATGPGVQVRVDDAPGARSFKQQVQAPDLQKLVNGLWLVGAEAVAVNGQRLSSLTAIRDAAGAITVNYVSLRRPYTVSAIGNPRTMAAQLLDTPGGRAWVTLQSTFGLKFHIDDKESMVLAPARRVTLRTARVLGAGR
ncbi:MAG: hypothetical protein QOF53_3775 [Nocardioidaceae bacterium]|jgi:uncharacterized protein YlxW (UPF0749 family)|nr:hypothetical protein [Nocardioidaceae bacterium]